MSGNRALGLGLLSGAGVITVLLLLWLVVSGATGGGIVLGLVLLVLLAGPFGGAGLFILSRQRAESLEAASFASKRRIAESDRLFRGQLAAELQQVALRPGLPAPELTEMVQELERPATSSAGWYETVQLDDSQVATLRRYDDLVWDRARRVRDLAGTNQAEGAVRELREALDQRTDLLLRGRSAPLAAPSALLRSTQPSRGLEAAARLGLRDAVSYEGADFLVEGVASAFAEGRTWKLVHLSPATRGAVERWLYIGPGGLELALLQEQPSPVPATGASTLLAPASSASLPLASSGTASVDLSSLAGSAQGVLVSYWLYRAAANVGLVERWPDGATHSYVGQVIGADDLAVWPSAPAPS